MTTDRDDPLLNEHKADGQQKDYLVLSHEERAKGFVRPVRTSYVHTGAGPFCGKPRTNADGSVSKCNCDAGHKGDCVSWTPEESFELREKGCGALTSMSSQIAETYAREPNFYDSTFCVGCQAHHPVGKFGEFIWADTDQKVGT